MLITDYYRSEPDQTWEIGRQLGIRHGVIRLPEDPEFDPAERSHWLTVDRRFREYGIQPIIVEPMPNCLHDHIKAGDARRDESIEKVIRMFSIMEELEIRTICFNWMTYVGWLRTRTDIQERGGALVTGFDFREMLEPKNQISANQLWDNYTYFLRAVIPEAERHGIRLALHPDDPPLANLRGVERIMISYENIHRAVYEIVPSSSLGITFCQASFYLMGQNLFEIIPKLAEKIMFIHFRNVRGTKEHFQEAFHDNGDLDMPALLRMYHRCGIDVPIRVDHVPTMVGETLQNAGYDALGRLYAIGYLRGILETIEK